MYLEDHVFQADIAKYFKVSPAMVSRLVREAKADIDKNKELLEKEKNTREMKDAVTAKVRSLLENSVPIVKAEMVAHQVHAETGVEATVAQVRAVMKDDMGLGYRLVKKVPVQSNSERCLVLR